LPGIEKAERAERKKEKTTGALKLVEGGGKARVGEFQNGKNPPTPPVFS
jgi:hypothetical protein